MIEVSTAVSEARPKEVDPLSEDTVKKLAKPARGNWV